MSDAAPVTETGTPVLIVEDNEMNREMLTRRLKRKGSTVLEAGDATTGISIARSRPIGVVPMLGTAPSIPVAVLLAEASQPTVAHR